MTTVRASIAMFSVAALACSDGGPARVDASAADASGADATADALPTGCDPATPVGHQAACECDAECPADTRCVPEIEVGYPGGACIGGCNPMEMSVCAQDVLCITDDALPPDVGLCQSTCTTADGCGAGRVCFGFVPGGEPGYCWPFCAADSECASGFCDVYSHTCTDGVPLGPGRLDAACVDDAECRSGHCLSGGCRSFCIVAEHCPEPARCVVPTGMFVGICVP